MVELRPECKQHNATLAPEDEFETRIAWTYKRDTFEIDLDGWYCPEGNQEAEMTCQKSWEVKAEWSEETSRRIETALRRMLVDEGLLVPKFASQRWVKNLLAKMTRRVLDEAA